MWANHLGISLEQEREEEGKAELLQQDPVIPPLSLLIPCEIVLDAGGSPPGSVDNRGCGDLRETRTTTETLRLQSTLLLLSVAALEDLG